MRLQKASSLLLFSIITLLTSCLTPKELDKLVAKEYEPILAAKSKAAESNISVISTLTYNGEQISTSTSKTSNMLPLLFYWQWNYTNTCIVNPQILVNNLKIALNNDRVLKDKLAEKKLQIVVTKVPNTFQVLDKAHLISFGIINHGWDDFSMKSTDMDMVISYKVLSSNVEVKSGLISIQNGNDKKELPLFKNLNKALKAYVIQFDENITLLSKRVAEKLASEM